MSIDRIIGKPVDTIEITNIRRLIEAFVEQLTSLQKAISQQYIVRQIDSCTGQNLDKIGEVVSLTRHQAGVMISDVKLAENDDVYRMMLKYKSMMNSSLCTVEEVISACRLIFNAVSVTYREVPSIPATFYVSVTAKFSEAVLSLLSSHSIVIRPHGVTARIACSDTQYFGFADCDDAALGFGQGVFAQSIT